MLCRPIKSFSIATIATFSLAMSGCLGFAGSRGQINFDNLKYPASMSAYLYGPDNGILTKDKELKVTKKLHLRKNSWNIFYTIIEISNNGDVVEEMNKEIAGSGGDGIVNVAVSSQDGITNSIPLLNLLPFWPTYSRITIKGDIVKYIK
jgi:hypothetical protein